MQAPDRIDELAQLRRMRTASLIEGTTLLLLLFGAVPLKHLAGQPLATTILGPIHGTAFVYYCWTLIQTVSAGGWTRAETMRMSIAALVPFGAFVNERWIARREASLRAAV